LDLGLLGTARHAPGGESSSATSLDSPAHLRGSPHANRAAPLTHPPSLSQTFDLPQLLSRKRCLGARRCIDTGHPCVLACLHEFLGLPTDRRNVGLIGLPQLGEPFLPGLALFSGLLVGSVNALTQALEIGHLRVAETKKLSLREEGTRGEAPLARDSATRRTQHRSLPTLHRSHTRLLTGSGRVHAHSCLRSLRLRNGILRSQRSRAQYNERCAGDN
jgi:hypothetical protein